MGAKQIIKRTDLSPFGQAAFDAVARLCGMQEDPGLRLDANETAFAARELEQVRTKIFEVIYAELMAQQFVPIASDILADVSNYVYYVLDEVGEARIIGPGAQDIPRVDVSKSERTGVVKSIAAAYGWELFELRNAIRTGNPLTTQKATAARRAIARAIDWLLSKGELPGQTALGMTGLLNNADVAGLGIAAGTFWTNATAATTMIAELTAVVDTIVTATNQTWIPDAVVLPTAAYSIFSQKPYGTDADSTALTWFLKNNPYIKSVSQWYRGNGAGATAKNRGIVYKKTPDVLEGVVPVVFEQLPPQVEGLEVVVNCLGRGGGVKIYHPEAMRYIDFALS